jgi:hypothetical protein
MIADCSGQDWPHHAIDADPAVSTIAAAPASAKKAFEPFSSAADTIVKGMKLPEYGADLPRTLTLVVAPCSTAAPASATAWKLYGFDSQSEHCAAHRASRHSGRPATEANGSASAGTIDLKRINMVLSGTAMTALPGDFGRKPCSAAADAIYGKVGDTPAISGPIGICPQVGVKLS